VTRYPKSGKWTVRELNAIGQDWLKDTLNDGEGLFGEVRPGEPISIVWKYAFRWQGKLCWHYCGTFPNAPMAKIRETRDIAKKALARGINPNEGREAEKVENRKKVEAVLAADAAEKQSNLTVADLFEAWLRDGVARKDGNKGLQMRFAKDVLPDLGGLPLKLLSETHLRDIYRKVLGRGVQRTVVDLAAAIRQMLSWAEKRQPWRALLIEGNPAQLVDVKLLLDHDYTEERVRVLSAEEIRELDQILKNTALAYENAPKKAGVERPLLPETQLALWISLSTLCRIGELLCAEWDHVNFETREWFIPAENTKGHRLKKQSLTVFLSDYSLQKFKELRALTGHTRWLFPSPGETGHLNQKAISKQVGDRQIMFKHRKQLSKRVFSDSLVLSNGRAGEWVVHDMRRTGATLMQSLGVSLDVIDRCQNHILAGSRVRRHYLHYDYQNEKRDAWQRLGERLSEILATPNLYQLRGAA